MLESFTIVFQPPFRLFHFHSLQNCLAEQTNNAYISLKDCDRLVLTVEIEGEYDEEGGDNGIKIKEDGNCTTM